MHDTVAGISNAYAEMKEKQAYGQAKTRSLSDALDVPQCGRQSLRDSVLSRAERAQSAKYEAEKIARLLHLCDKNPELFEMISLLRDLNFIQ